MKFVFSPDVILCGWLGSKHQLTISSLIYPLTPRGVGAPWMNLKPIAFIFSCSPLPSGTWRTPACPFLDVVFQLLPLSALSSSSFHCALQNGFGQTWWTGNMTIPLQFASLHDRQEVFGWSDCLLDLGTDFLVGNMIFVWDAKYLAVALISMTCILLWTFAVRVHDSQAHRKMDMTRESIRRTLKLREILLSFQSVFNLVNTAAVCAILKNISGLKPSSVISEPRYLKLVTVSSFCPFTLISVLMPLASYTYLKQ